MRWLVPEAAVRSPLRVLRRVGRHRALIGEWEVDDRRGVVGETPSQSTVARLGLDDQDTLYGAGPTSMLFRTTIGERDVALASGRRVPEPGARAISVPSGDDVRGGSVAGAVIVIPSGDTVLVSTDRGHRFRRSAPLGLDSLETVIPRADGTVVAVGKVSGDRRVMLSPDAGARWVRSRLQPPVIASIGAILWNADPRCPAVLSRNGLDWVGLPEAEDSLRRLRERAWDPLVRASREVKIVSAIARATFDDPAPPMPPEKPLDQPTCASDDIVPAIDESPASHAQLLLPGVEGPDGFFPARLSTGLIEAPSSCRTGHLVGAHEQTVLVCGAAAGSSLYLVETGIPVDSGHDEPMRAPSFRGLGALPHPPEAMADIAFPPDREGRLFFHHRTCIEGGPCRVSIVASNGKARELAVEGASAYWPHERDGVIAVITKRSPERFSVELIGIDADDARRRIVAVQGPGVLDDVGTREDGAVFITARLAGAEMRWAVTTDGGLIASD